MKFKSAILATVTAAGLFAGAAQAEDPVKLRFSHVFAETHWLWVQAGKIFTDEVTKASDGRITFEVYPAGQLGKETVSLVEAGLADVGIAVPSYEAGQLPLSSVLELPGVLSSSCDGAAKFAHLAAPGGALYEDEYKKLGVHVLYVNVVPPYSLITSQKEVLSLDDVKGLKVRANGDAMTMTANAIGAAPVPVTSSELFDALSRGTVDGILLAVGSVNANSLADVVKYIVEPTKLGQGVTFAVINQSVWDSLSPEDQKILTDAGNHTQEALCKYLDEREDQQLGQLVADGKLKVIDLTEEQQKVWHDALSKVADEWVKNMDAAGKPGDAVLKALREAPSTF